MKLVSLLSLLATANAFTTPFTKSHTPNTKLNLQKSVEDAILEAQQICAVDPTSDACKVAWDIVEELEAADSHRNTNTASDGGVEVGADVEAFLSSLDILTKKIDGKMDQLKGISYKLQELGATDPSIGDLAYQADVMKQVIYNARASLGRY